jgi:hypothetical protein
VYIADTDNHRIQVFDADGTFLGKWGSEGSGDGQFLAPRGWRSRRTEQSMSRTRATTASRS